MKARPPLLLLDGWQLELHFMLCMCGHPACPRFAWQVYALSPEEVFDDLTEAYAQVFAETRGDTLHKPHKTLQ